MARSLIRPPRLKKGDLVRVVSMSGTFPKASWKTVELLTDALGLRVEFGKSMFEDPGYLGRDPRKRADDFNSAVASDRVRGIFLFRGGNSASEVLPWIDFGALRKHPKVIAGYSDHSSIVMAAHAAAHMVTFLVPPVLAAPGPRDLTLDSFRRILMDGEAWVAMPSRGAETWRKGKASGTIVAANLRILQTLMGTPYRPSLEGAILCWEEIGESIQDINTIFSQMRNAGVLDSLSGMVVGHLEEIPPREDGFSVKEHVLGKLTRVPVMKTKAYGHFRPCFTLPLGVQATLDAGKRAFVIERSAVD